MLFFKKEEAMTKWWLKLVANIIVLESMSWPFDFNNGICFFKGIAASSSACIGIGYYIMTLMFNQYNSPQMSLQLYISQKLENVISYPVYIVLDTMVHVFSTTLVFYYWHKYITIYTALAAFIFHRMWSLVNSEFKSIYLNGDDIYLPVESPNETSKRESFLRWVIFYIGESCVLIVFTIVGEILRSL
jgi:hypothetical protein